AHRGGRVARGSGFRQPSRRGRARRRPSPAAESRAALSVHGALHRVAPRIPAARGRRSGRARLISPRGCGFDGSEMRRRSEIEATLDRIFADHETSTYVGNVREELAITDDVSLVLAVCGMVPRGRSELNSAVNAIQTLLAVRTDGDWKLVDF